LKDQDPALKESSAGHDKNSPEKTPKASVLGKRTLEDRKKENEIQIAEVMDKENLSNPEAYSVPDISYEGEHSTKHQKISPKKS
jgi:hypothetical protein